MNYQISKKQKERIAKRNKQIKRRVMFISVICLILISIGILSINTKADVEINDSLKKYYQSVTVSADDTLWDYANTYSPDGRLQKYIDEVMRMNHMNSSDLVVGQNLILPYYV